METYSHVAAVLTTTIATNVDRAAKAIKKYISKTNTTPPGVAAATPPIFGPATPAFQPF